MDCFLFDRDLHCSRLPTAEANFVKNTKKNFIIMLIFPNIILSRINIRVCFVQCRSNSDSRNSTRCNNAPFTKNSWVSCGFGHIYWKNPERKTSIFAQWFLKRPQISQLFLSADLIYMIARRYNEKLDCESQLIPENLQRNLLEAFPYIPLTKMNFTMKMFSGILLDYLKPASRNQNSIETTHPVKEFIPTMIKGWANFYCTVIEVSR